MTDKKAHAHDKVLGAMEFKKKGRTGFEGKKSLTPAGLPEIEFIGVKAGKAGEPLVVGDGKIEFHVLTFYFFFKKSVQIK